ncbi:MAG: GtrA family protein [Paludisphaera borealis]|uniref:GtrA family protein n=1 Tax=Paludisphaera borealis TaxID=1387353 RepID=UPI00283FDFEB|nr:GtrA family protein [Paludisphaera borealis]MDR3618563.1 GtrA family protein [Paludisphaera borealis]
MSRISLIIPWTAEKTIRGDDLASYQRILQEQGGADSVEVVLSERIADADAFVGLHPLIRIVEEDANHVSLLRRGLAAATGDILLVLDPTREYAPEALLQVLGSLRTSTADVVVGVPRPGRNGLTLRGMQLKALAVLGRLALGTSDGLSGLAAIRRSAVRTLITESPTISGSRILLDVLTWCSGRLLDVPVNTGRDDQRKLVPVRFDDVKQIKRVLDHRFGTISRLVQFCLVGASGMFVDLSLYAFLQWLFKRIGFESPEGAGSGFAWSLAVAGSLSILVALTWNFALNRRLTFSDSRAGSIPRQYLTYALGNALGIAVSLSLRLYLPGRFAFFSDHRLAAAVVGIIAATAISFSMSRWVVFIRQAEPVVDESTQETALAR